MIKSVEQVCEQLPHFGTICQEGKDIEIWAKPFIPSKDDNGYHVPGIYCIENWLANKIYIGMSKDIATRIGVHKRELNPLNNVCHPNPEMDNDARLYGLHNFSFGIIETFEDMDRKYLLKREEEWIKHYENQSAYCIYNRNRCTKYDDIEIISDTTYMKNKVELSLNSKEQFPIDYLISDVLQIKVEAHNIQNEKLYQYADYLEKRLMQFKKGEIEFVKDIQGE